MNLEAAFFWLAVVLYAVATLSAVAGLAFRSNSLVRTSVFVTAAGFAAESASIIVRWSTSGRLPFIKDYENLLAGTWAIVLLYLLVVARWRETRIVGVGVLPFVLLSMGWAVSLSAQASPVTPPYRSIWLGVHVMFAWATYAAYTTAAGLALVELLKSRNREIDPQSPLAKAPSLERIRELTMKLVMFGFVVNGVMIASGAIWAYELWGSYWRWDPVETWSLLTWLAYAFYLHAQMTLGWRGPRLAWVAFLALFGVLMMFWGVQLAPTSYHLFRDLGNGVTESRPF